MPSGRTSGLKKFFEVWIIPELDPAQRLLTGQRVIARIKLRSKPLAVQWWLAARQLFQRRFHI